MARLPLPSKKAVTYIRKMATAQMNVQVVIHRPDTPQFNAATGMTTGRMKSTVYAGPARVYQASGGYVQQDGEALTVYRQTTVSIPWDDAIVPQRDDMVEVTDASAASDPSLEDRWFRVLDVVAGGMAYPTRTMTVQGVEPNEWWTGS